ncbi:MAG: terminase, partial [Oscillibacter sp.]|nr:terminase [Oscillibacter sp.]
MNLTTEAVLYYANHPVHFVEDIIRATPDPEQAKILESVARNPMTSVRSGHGIGKSTVEAWVVIWFL